jgi:hypothetical protein
LFEVRISGRAPPLTGCAENEDEKSDVTELTQQSAAVQSMRGLARLFKPRTRKGAPHVTTREMINAVGDSVETLR